MMLSTRGNKTGSPFSGISPSSRKNIGAGATVKAIKPIVIAPRFLPSRFEMTGEMKNAINAEITTLREIKPICSVVKPQKNVEK